MTDKIKTMTNDEIINYINTIVTDELDIELAELKAILAELSGRKMEKKYINIIAEKIKAKIQPEPVEVKRKPAPEPLKEEKKEEKKETASSKPTFDDLYAEHEEDDDLEEERYPISTFLMSLYKIFAWILLAGFILVGGIVSLMIFKSNIPVVCVIMFGSVIMGVFSLVGFYRLSEKIKIQLDIEKNLRDLLNK